MQTQTQTQTQRILWLNGAFGVGKSTVAERLLKRLPRSRIVDPERVGYVMQRTFWRRRDYQDVRLWRHATAMHIRLAAKVTTGRIIVPMTIVDRTVLDEITAHLSADDHAPTMIVLTAPRDIIASRIAREHLRDGNTMWRLANLDRCLAAFNDDEARVLGQHIDTHDRSPEDVVDDLLSRIG